MKPITIASIAFIIAGSVTGLYAAWYWFRASRVKLDPEWDFEPVETEAAQNGWIVATQTNIAKSSNLNGIAALLTGVCVSLSAIGSLLSMATAWVR